MKRLRGYSSWQKKIIALAVAMILSFLLSGLAASTDYHAKEIDSLDKKKEKVMELMTASTSTSIALTLLPDDNATPIAEELAELSSYFLVILGAIFLEKYLLTLTGLITFRFLIPIACSMLIANLYRRDNFLKDLAYRCIAFGLAIYLVVPTSLQITNVIEGTYDHSMEQTIEEVKEITDSIQDASSSETGITGFLTRFVDGVKGVLTIMKSILNSFLETIAILIVTSCVFPVLTFLCFVWIIKLIWGVKIELPKTKEVEARLPVLRKHNEE